MAQDTPSRKLDQYIVRFPDGLRDQIKEAADANKRSMNAEIVARLEQSFAPASRLPVITDRVRDAARLVAHVILSAQSDEDLRRDLALLDPLEIKGWDPGAPRKIPTNDASDE